MIDDAITDSRRAIALNEDIFLASLFIIAVMSFSTVSIFANTLYTFMLTATFLSELSGISMLFLATIALGVLSISILWLCAWMQNLITISLMEAVNRKRNRSLRLTIRNSLRLAPLTAYAWLAVLLVAVIPAVTLLVLSLLIIYFGEFELQTVLPYLAGAAVISVSWIIYALANYSLLPQMVLFGKKAPLADMLKQSRKLVKSRGKYFIVSTYLLVAICLAGIYYLSVGIENALGINRSLPFLTLMVLPITLGNALLTMLYRKRKLSRR